jgi:hypothetical protein
MFRDKTDPHRGNIIGTPSIDFTSIKNNFALPRGQQPNDGFESGGLARTVAPEQCRDRTFRHADIYTLQDVILRYERVDVLNVEDGFHEASESDNHEGHKGAQRILIN